MRRYARPTVGRFTRCPASDRTRQRPCRALLPPSPPPRRWQSGGRASWKASRPGARRWPQGCARSVTRRSSSASRSALPSWPLHAATNSIMVACVSKKEARGGTTMATPEVCFLVARDDENVMERVAKHLVGMRRRYEQRGVTFALYSLDHQWELDAFSRQRLLEAVAVIGVISPSLLSILGLNEALRTVLAEKREQRRGRLLPFVLVSCDWQHEETPFSDLQPLNASG